MRGHPAAARIESPANQAICTRRVGEKRADRWGDGADELRLLAPRPRWPNGAPVAMRVAPEHVAVGAVVLVVESLLDVTSRTWDRLPSLVRPQPGQQPR